jgi:hypothetical protein
MFHVSEFLRKGNTDKFIAFEVRYKVKAVVCRFDRIEKK